jgi:para-nitrobenzyl esterase
MSSDALLGDDLVGYPMWRWIQAQKRTGKAPVYRFLFDWRPPAPEVSRTPLAGPGVFHSAEIPYALDNLAAMPWPWRDSDRRVAQVMSSYWINFATKGDPNGAGLPHWPVYAGGDDSEVMHFGSDARAIKQPRQEHFRLLDELYREP